MRLTTTTLSFGALLKQLRKQVGMTQRDLAAALNYSDSLISSLEKEQRLPDLTFVAEQLIPALGLQDDPKTAAWLIERAAAARGEQPPAAFTFHRTTQLVMHEEWVEQGPGLPALPTPLIGRGEEVTQLCHRLLGHQGRLVTLLGPPGIGKTTLALTVAQHLQPHYRDGVVFVPLAAIDEANMMISAILATIGHSESSSKPPKARLIEFLRRKTMLLVLDNLEQIGDAAPLIADLLAECPGLVVLATSRERLHLRAEQRYKVPPLALAAAVELFVQRAQAVESAFQQTQQNQATLTAICERLDRLPLAIELCAAQSELFSPAQLLTQLQTQPLDLLVDGAQDLPPQQRTLRRAIQRSYQLLDDAERSLLRSVSCFVGGFALPEVEQVSSSPPEMETRSLATILHALLHKSLVRSEMTATGAQRFFLLETIREFALEQLRLHGEEGALRERHYAAYLHLFRSGDSHLRGPESATWMGRLAPEQDNLRAALQWAIAEKRYTDAAWLHLAGGFFWFLRGQRHEAAQWVGQLLPHRYTFDNDLRLALLISFCAFAGLVEGFLWEASYLDEMHQLLEQCSDLLLQSAGWFWITIGTTDFAQTTTALQRATALARLAQPASSATAYFGACSDRDFMLSGHLQAYAGLLLEQGNIAQAASLATESLELFRLRQNHYGMGDCLGALGHVALLQGDLVQADAHFQAMFTIATTFHYPLMQCEWQPLFALVSLYRGNVQEARRLLTESLELCLTRKEKNFLARNYGYRAEVALWEGELAQAAEWLGKSFVYENKEHSPRIFQVEIVWLAARLAIVQQHYQRAATLFGLAERVSRHFDNVPAGPMAALAATALTTVRATLAPAAFAEAFAAGQQMSLAAVFAPAPMPTSGLSQG